MKRRNDNKTNIGKICAIVVGVILVLSTAFVFLVFRTDYIYNVDADSTFASANFERISVTTVIEEIERLKGGDGTLVPGENTQPRNSTGWYEDIPQGTPSGNTTGVTFDGVSLYKGLPWPADDSTYIYYQYKAKEDIYNLFNQCGINKTDTGRSVVNSPVSSVPVTSDVDGVKSLNVGTVPAAIDRDYFPTKAFSQANGGADSGAVNYQLKFAIVLVPEGADKSDKESYFYLPASKVDAKAHTFFGGVVQTNVKVIDDHTIQISKDWSGTKNYQDVTLDSSRTLRDVLDELNNKLIPQYRTVDYDMGVWYSNDLETYNLSQDTVSALSDNYDIVGIVYWGGYNRRLQGGWDSGNGSGGIHFSVDDTIDSIKGQ